MTWAILNKGNYAQLFWASLVAQMVKNPPVMQETCVWSLDQKDPLEKGMVSNPIFSPGEFHGERSLAGYSPWGRRVGHDWVTNTLIFLGLSIGYESLVWEICTPTPPLPSISFTKEAFLCCINCSYFLTLSYILEQRVGEEEGENKLGKILNLGCQWEILLIGCCYFGKLSAVLTKSYMEVGSCRRKNTQGLSENMTGSRERELGHGQQELIYFPKQKLWGQHVVVVLLQSLSCVQLLWHSGLQPSRLLCPWDFPGKNTGVGCHFLLQGIFLMQGLNPGIEPSLLGWGGFFPAIGEHAAFV